MFNHLRGSHTVFKRPSQCALQPAGDAGSDFSTSLGVSVQDACCMSIGDVKKVWSSG